MEKRDDLALILAFTAGVLCGAIAGILFAPEKGEKTRERIKEAGKKIKGKIEDFVKHKKEAIAEKKSVIAKAVEAGKKAMKEEVEKIKEKA